MATTEELQSRYVRQLAARDLGESATWLGENVLLDWDTTKIFFACKWRNLAPAATSMMLFNPRGGAIEFDLPRIPSNPYEIEVHDWDAELRAQLQQWMFDRQELRWHSPGHHIAVGQILTIKDERPSKRMLNVVFNFKSLFFYATTPENMSHVNYDPWIDATKQSTQGRLYGEAMAVS